MRRMYQNHEDVYYYIAVMNENYTHPALHKGTEEGILKGMYRLPKTGKAKAKINLLGSGTILREVIAAADLLKSDFKINADVWSVTSFNELRKDGLETTRWNMLHPEEKQRISYVETLLNDETIPTVAATDYMKIYADQIREFIPGNYSVLGTDGFGRSDSREKLRYFFEVDRYFIVIAALKSLVDANLVKVDQVSKALEKYNIDPSKPNPLNV